MQRILKCYYGLVKVCQGSLRCSCGKVPYGAAENGGEGTNCVYALGGVGSCGCIPGMFDVDILHIFEFEAWLKIKLVCEIQPPLYRFLCCIVACFSG